MSARSAPRKYALRVYDVRATWRERGAGGRTVERAIIESTSEGDVVRWRFEGEFSREAATAREFLAMMERVRGPA